MEVLEAVEQLRAVHALKTSFYVYPLVNALHIGAVGALLTSVWMLDLRLLGRLSALPEAAFADLMRKVALGAFVTAAVSGALLFAVRATDYAFQPVFLAKMGLIGLAGLNLIVSRRLSGSAGSPYVALRLTFAVSMAVWVMVLVAGRFVGFA
jgi:predicted Abi (CAAX) family protease